MDTINRLSWALLALAITALLGAQGLFLYKQAIRPDIGLQITIDVDTSDRCRLPSYKEIKEAIRHAQSPNSPTVLADQIRVSLVHSVLTAVLPANSIMEDDLRRLERSLNDMVVCQRKMASPGQPLRVFHISSAKRFPVHQIRPLDLATLVILLFSDILLLRAWLKRQPREITQ